MKENSPKRFTQMTTTWATARRAGHSRREMWVTLDARAGQVEWVHGSHRRAYYSSWIHRGLGVRRAPSLPGIGMSLGWTPWAGTGCWAPAYWTFTYVVQICVLFAWRGGRWVCGCYLSTCLVCGVVHLHTQCAMLCGVRALLLICPGTLTLLVGYRPIWDPFFIRMKGYTCVSYRYS